MDIIHEIIGNRTCDITSNDKYITAKLNDNACDKDIKIYKDEYIIEIRRNFEYATINNTTVTINAKMFSDKHILHEACKHLLFDDLYWKGFVLGIALNKSNVADLP
jgi:hypothetical protein